jgi:hypothetical protein
LAARIGGPDGDRGSWDGTVVVADSSTIGSSRTSRAFPVAARITAASTESYETRPNRSH